MDKLKAVGLIRQHRYWLSKESDYAIARRAEHVYTNVAAVMLVIAACWMSSNGSLVIRLVPSVLFLAFAGFCHFRSQQFVKIRHEFEDRWPQNISDLDAKQDTQSAADNPHQSPVTAPGS